MNPRQMNDILKTLREEPLFGFKNEELQLMMQTCHLHIQNAHHWAPPALTAILFEALRRRLDNLSEQTDRLTGVAKDLRSAAERMERQTDKIIRLTWGLLILTAVLLAATVALMIKA